MEPIFTTDLPKTFGPDVALVLSPECFALWCGLKIGPSLLISDVASHFHIVKSEWPLYFYCQRHKNTEGETAIIDFDSVEFELPTLLSKDGALKLRATLSFVSGIQGFGFFLKCVGKEVDAPILWQPTHVDNWSVFWQRLSLGTCGVLSSVDHKDTRNFYLQIHPSEPPEPRKINRLRGWI